MHDVMRAVNSSHACLMTHIMSSIRHLINRIFNNLQYIIVLVWYSNLMKEYQLCWHIFIQFTDSIQ